MGVKAKQALQTIKNRSRKPVYREQDGSQASPESLPFRDREKKRMSDESLYLEATNEVESDKKDLALWAKVMALSEGDQGKAKYHYIRLKVEQLAKKASDKNPLITKKEPINIKRFDKGKSKKSLTKESYSWKKVLFWTLIIFISTYLGAQPPPEYVSSGAPPMGYKIALALPLAIIFGVIFGLYKYFRR